MSLNLNILSLLHSRTKRLPGECYKLSDAGAYGMDISFSEDMEINEEEMSIVIPFASGTRRDGVGDLLEVAGINTERHRLNPVVLFDHGKQVTLPIGLAEDPRTKRYTVTIDPILKEAKCKAFFYQGRVGNNHSAEHTLFCEQLFDLMAQRYVRAGSIGYQVIHARELQADYDRGTPKGLHLINTLMLEASAVVMPANMDTVRKALCLSKVCGKPLSPMLVKSLTPYTASYTKTTVGFMAQGTNGTDSVPTLLLSQSPVPHIKSVRDLYRKKLEVKVKSSPGVSDIKKCLQDGGVDVLTITQVAGSQTLKVIVDRSQINAAKHIIHQNGYTSLQVIVEGGDKSMNIRSLYKRKALDSKTKAMTRQQAESLIQKMNNAFGLRCTLMRYDSQFDRYYIGLYPTSAIMQGKVTTGVLSDWLKDNGAEEAAFAGGLWFKGLSDKHQVKSMLSSDISPEKAREILKDGSVHEHPLTEKQRGMFGAAAGKDKKSIDPEDANGQAIKVGDRVKITTLSGKMGKVIRIQSGGYPIVQLDGESTANAWQEDELIVVSSRSGGPDPKTDRKSIRLKYRKSKGFRRVLRKGAAGSSMVYVSNKDLDSVKKLASERGLEAKYVGSKNGLEKVRLTGDEKAMDEVARQYGRPMKTFSRG